MKHAHFLTTVAAGLLLSTAAFAQAPAKDKTDAGAAPAPAAQQSAPAEKTAPMKDPKSKAEMQKSPSMDKSTQNTPMKPSDANSSAGAKPAAQTATPDSKTDTKASSSTSTTTTTGQGSAAGAAKLSTEQRTQITTVFKQQKVERIEPSKLNISISVGTRIPTTVKYHPLPREVIVIYPEWRGYDYILVGDQIVIINPRSHEIVAILDA